MASWKGLLDSKYLKQEDIGAGKLVTLESIDRMNVAMDNQPEDLKPAAKFRELKKPLILNGTNLQLMAVVAGSDDVDEWIGKQFVLFCDPTVQYMGKIVGGIRVRKPKPGAKAQAAPEPEPELIDDDDPVPF